MTTSNAVPEQIVQALLAAGGVLSSPQLQQALNLSQATVSRALAGLISSGQVVKVGAARSQRYLLPRAVPGTTGRAHGLGAKLGHQHSQSHSHSLPVMRINPEGQATLFAQLTPLHGGAFWLDEVAGAQAAYPGLPWFLDDMQPQGFMGRGFGQSHPELQLASDPRQWSVDDMLRVLCQFGEDLPGDLIVGDASWQRYQAQAQQSVEISTTDYPRLAQLAMQSTHGGSSAGGEQPKFCASVAGRAVLVKFSPAGASPAEQRSRDLLVCEHLALQTLAQAGISAARTQLLSAAGRVFLESERFDRTAQRGRIGMVSLLAFDAQHIGEMDNWAASAQRMASRQLLTPANASTLCLLEAYGQLIANTDRHYGNISLLRQGAKWCLAPAYDMLPMLYAPINAELVERDFAARLPQASAATLAQWPLANTLAMRFWHSAANNVQISGSFRQIAGLNAAALSAAA